VFPKEADTLGQDTDMESLGTNRGRIEGIIEADLSLVVVVLSFFVAMPGRWRLRSSGLGSTYLVMRSGSGSPLMDSVGLSSWRGCCFKGEAST